MKKLIACLFLILILSSSFISASAEFEADAKLNVSYCFKGQNVVITAFFTDIKVKDGIISVEYDIKYDHNKFELVKIELWNIRDQCGHRYDGAIQQYLDALEEYVNTHGLPHP